MKRKVIFITCLSLLLTSFQITNNQSAVAAICGGPAAYPPDLPDCLDPVVEEQRVAAAEAAARASASAAASRAAADAAAAQALEQARLEREAAAAAKAKADSDKAAADALAAQIREGNLAAAAAAAATAAAAARDAAVAAATAKRLADEELTRKVEAEAAAQAAIVTAREALANAQARIAREIEEARAESQRLKAEAEANKRAADAAAAAFAAERIALDRAIAEKEALRIAKEAQAAASAASTANARQAYLDASETFSLRMADVQSLTQSLTIKKEVLLTQTYPQSNLKIQNNTLPVFVTADELAALLRAYNAAKEISDADSRAAADAREEKRLADVALAARKAIADAADAAWKESARLKNLEDQKVLTAAAERTALENAIRVREAAAAAAALAAAAAQADLERKTAADTVASTAAASMTSAAATLASITSDSGDSASLANAALAAFQSAAAASSSAAATAAAEAAAAERLSAAEAAALRARQEADAARDLAARRPTESSPGANVSSAEAIAAQEAEARARELEKKAQEAAKLAAEAKELAEKAEAEKQAADKAAADAKAKADKAAADAKTKEEAKRNAAKKQIARDKAAAKKLLEESKKSAIDNAKEVNKSSQTINSAYEQALTEAAKANKALAKLKEQEKSALSSLNLARNELLTLGKVLDKADLEQKQAIAQYGSSQYKLTAIQTSIDTNEKLLVVVDKEITTLQSNYNQLQAKYESLDKAAQSAADKAAESKKKSDAAYQELMAASKSNSLVANGFTLIVTATPEVDFESFNATSALEKLRERYQNALEQANKDKALAEKVLRDLQIAREAAVKAKQSLDLKITQRSKLKSELITLNSKLKVAKDELEVSTSIKVKAVSTYTIAANNLAQKTNKFREIEITYQDAKSETKYEFENANSRDNQVAFLRKLSELSKSSVATARGVIDGIDQEFRNLDSSQALDLINSDIKVGFISTSIPVILFTAASAIAIYAYLARRKRRSKFDLASVETLARIREQQAARSNQEKERQS